MTMPKILIVDDRPENLTAMQIALEDINAEIVTALSGKEALRLLLKKNFTLILLDVQMPDMNGFETAELIRSRKNTKNIPIIFLTAINKDEEHAIKGYESGAIDYIYKPVNPNILISKVNSLLKHYNEQEQQNKLKELELKKLKNKLSSKDSKVKELAMYDILTTIPNRFTFNEIGQKIFIDAQNNNRQIALLFIDIDNFKIINDQYGHDHGDIILKQTAAKLKECIHDSDLIARLGGDEFAIIFLNVQSEKSIISLAERIITLFKKQPFFLENKSIPVEVSIGISINDNNTKDFDSFVKQADIAMYHAKLSGKNCFDFYSESLRKFYHENNKLAIELNNALSKNELILYWQPIVDLDNNRIAGLESLIRWKNEKLGFVSPGLFIPLAEKNGHIHDIGLWVLDTACRQISEWIRFDIKNLFFTINVSPKQFEKKGFKNEVNSIISRYGIDPLNIELEITESAINSNFGIQFKESIIHLRQLHLRLSIDDFGKAHSSLDRLNKYPINTLKIDGSFIRVLDNNPKAQSIVQNTISLSHELSMNTIAECVETKEQAEFLRQNNCHLAQGFYFYKPMPAEEITELLLK